MSHFPGSDRALWLVVAIGATCALSCSSTDSPAPGGGGPLDASAEGEGGRCHGDATAWATLTQGPIACVKNSDCCVIVNGCTSEAQVVAAEHVAAAKAAWPTCDDACNRCIPPPTAVGCRDGACTGTVVDLADASPALMADHCGVDGPPVLIGGVHFGCGG